MIFLIRRLLGMDREPTEEQRDRDDALRSAKRARELADRLRKARRQELMLRLEVRTRR